MPLSLPTWESFAHKNASSWALGWSVFEIWAVIAEFDIQWALFLAPVFSLRLVRCTHHWSTVDGYEYYSCRKRYEADRCWRCFTYCTYRFLQSGSVRRVHPLLGVVVPGERAVFLRIGRTATVGEGTSAANPSNPPEHCTSTPCQMPLHLFSVHSTLLHPGLR